MRRGDGVPRFRLLWLSSSSTVSIEELTLQNGRTADLPGTSGTGGGIYNEGELALTRVSLLNNRSVSNGGALLNTGSTLLQECTLLFNRLEGSGTSRSGTAIWSNDYVRLVNSSINQNFGRYAISTRTDSSVLEITGSSIISNDGAGIEVASGASAIIENSTISGNGPQATRGPEGVQLRGAGVFVNEGTLELIHTTVADNEGSEGGGLWINPTLGGATLANSIVAENVPTDCWGTLSSEGGNLLGNAFGCDGLTDGVNGDIVGTDPQLGPLASNGGFTPTRLPDLGSPVIDRGLPTGCLPTDQRDVVRPQGAACDIGAVEVESSIVEVVEVPTLDRLGFLFMILVVSIAGLRRVHFSSPGLTGSKAGQSSRTNDGSWGRGENQ